MKKELCWIVPSRDRPKKLSKFIKSFIANNKESDLYVIIDHDDKKYKALFTNERIQQLERLNVFILINKTKNYSGKFLHILNDYSMMMCDKYNRIGFLEDDCVIVTQNIDQKILNHDYSVIYLNDKKNAPNGIAGAPIIKSSVVKKLGYYSPPELKCLWADYYWKVLGDTLGSILFLRHVYVKHEHYEYNDNDSEKDDIARVMEVHYPSDKIEYHKNRNKYIEHIKKNILEN